MRYYIQHGAGLGDLVADTLKVDLGDANFLFRDDSSVVFETRLNRDRVASLSYVKNAFQVLGNVQRGGSVPGAVGQMVKMIRKRALLRNERRGTAFRTMANVDGQLIGLPRETRTQLESVIAEQTGGRFNARGGSGAEYWIVGRRELDSLMFCLRLTTGAQKTGARGSLSSDLATLLIKASSPQPGDTFLDPFGGSGSLVAARINAPFRKAIYSDTNVAELRPQLSPLLLNSQKVDILAEDALQLPSVPDGSITSIVTDPPWGEHEDLDSPYDEFAARMMKSFDRVLDRQHGRLVLLLSRWASADVAPLWEQSNLRVRGSHSILVNGHPATVLVGGR